MSIGREDPSTGALPDIDLTQVDVKRVVSRRHAEVSYRDNGAELRDVGSTNGTYINGTQLPVLVFRPLNAGDRVSFGGVNMTYRDQAEWPDEITPEWDRQTLMSRQSEKVFPAAPEHTSGSKLEPDRVLATVMFTDIAQSTVRAVELGDRQWLELLHSHHALVRVYLKQFGGREIDTAGDGFLAVFASPASAIRCALAIREGANGLGMQVRSGLHTGECLMLGNDIGGIAVHIAARVESKAIPDEVLVSATVKELVAGSGLGFRDRGARALKGVPGKWRLYAVESLPETADANVTAPMSAAETAVPGEMLEPEV
ncbi:MAG TPA: adenylate/guanylate cyclase domain-containing protein [Candidatus Dormibacteraeota bacterium]|jgi:class 3 adenylate cyclase|nr:adenylate/guanylate cyclase domain-containing protein [Candidatus Dormibacteraeota bacterium]